MKLTDLNIDCLEKILEYLKLEDLLNVADSNKRLCHAAKFVFFDKYRTYTVDLSFAYTSKQKCMEDDELFLITMEDKRIICSYLKCTLQLLRNFSHFISGINYHLIFSHLHREATQHIIKYLSDFCHETLEYIFIRLSRESLLDHFKRPFTNVKTVKIEGVLAADSLIQFFLNMENLQFGWSDYLYYIRTSIANHFPHLKYIKISSQFQAYCREEKRIENLKALLRLNPQFTHLYMECGSKSEIELLQSFNEREKNPKYVDLLDVEQFFKYSNGKVINLRNVEHLSIRKYSRDQTMGEIPIICDKLISFQIELDEQSIEYIHRFYQNNLSIRKLTLGFLALNDFTVNFSRLAKSLPLLHEITSWYGKLSVCEVYNILTMFKSLKYFCFVGVDAFDFRKLESDLNGQWSIRSTKNTTNYIALKCKI